MIMKRICAGGLTLFFALATAFPGVASAVEAPEAETEAVLPATGTEESFTPTSPEISGMPGTPEDLETQEEAAVPEVPVIPVQGGLDGAETSPAADTVGRGETMPSDNMEEVQFSPSGVQQALPSPESVTDNLFEDGEIRVTVPQSGHIFVNPYGMKVTLEGQESTDEIVSTSQVITNNSSVPVIVQASAVGSIVNGSSAAFVSSPPLEDSGEKEIFLYAEFQTQPSDPENENWQGSYTGADNQILIDEHPSEPQPVLELGESGTETACGVFRLFGETTYEPEDPWVGEEVFEVVLTFTFQAMESELSLLPEEIAPTDAGVQMVPDGPAGSGDPSLPNVSVAPDGSEEPNDPNEADGTDSPAEPEEPEEPNGSDDSSDSDSVSVPEYEEPGEVPSEASEEPRDTLPEDAGLFTEEP